MQNKYKHDQSRKRKLVSKSRVSFFPLKKTPSRFNPNSKKQDLRIKNKINIFSDVFINLFLDQLIIGH